mgnify:CR=1 FL=1
MAKIIRTEKDSDKRFAVEELKVSTKGKADFKLDETKTYQEMIGFGGALLKVLLIT